MKNERTCTMYFAVERILKFRSTWYLIVLKTLFSPYFFNKTTSVEKI